MFELMKLHEQNVKNFFDTPKNYLHKNFGIRLRKELVDKLTNGKKFDQVLDIGCGDGSLSLPFLAQFNHLTLNDLSEEMLNLADKNLELSNLANLKDRVSKSKGSFLVRDFTIQFDLILMIGVLAHVNDLDSAVEKLSNLIAPNGHLIIQFSEYNHPLTRATHLFNTRGYSINRLSYKTVRSLFNKRFELMDEIKYLIPFPGMSLFNDEFLFVIQQYISRNKFLSSMGTDYFIKYRKV